jgi:hypothetical protein
VAVLAKPTARPRQLFGTLLSLPNPYIKLSTRIDKNQLIFDSHYDNSSNYESSFISGKRDPSTVWT